MQARHLPRFDRDLVPLVVSADERVLWVPGVEVAAFAAIRPTTSACLEVCAMVTEPLRAE
ncbi:MAG TPA: tRNA lysidine(34) synthetase TilS C-terminal domain-containing protein [Planctomycetota bacterium]|nr:tRNA lysidine(34) synthetase TilS C-terminal domain-containing protein [Planctomycetota bacterium]